MDVSIRIIRAKEFIYSTASGQLDLTRSKMILVQLANVNRPTHRDILLDLREASRELSELSATNVTELVSVMQDHRDSFAGKLAILLAPEASFERAASMELYANNRGFQVGVFMEFEAAIHWITIAQEITLPNA